MGIFAVFLRNWGLKFDLALANGLSKRLNSAFHALLIADLPDLRIAMPFRYPNNRETEEDMQMQTSSLKLGVVLLATLLATGCIKANIPSEEAAPVAAPTTFSSWTVENGNHLWGIAGKDQVYSAPQHWPLIYKANVDQIEDADLIFPGQVLAIPSNPSTSEVNAAVKHAKNRGAWAVGPVEASDKAYMKNSG